MRGLAIIAGGVTAALLFALAIGEAIAAASGGRFAIAQLVSFYDALSATARAIVGLVLLAIALVLLVLAFSRRRRSRSRELVAAVSESPAGTTRIERRVIEQIARHALVSSAAGFVVRSLTIGESGEAGVCRLRATVTAPAADLIQLQEAAGAVVAAELERYVDLRLDDFELAVAAFGPAND